METVISGLDLEEPAEGDRPRRWWTQGPAAFLVLLAVLALVAGVLIYRAAATESEARAVVRASFMRELLLARMFGAVVDSESGQRGYFLTGDETYLDPLEDGRVVAFSMLDTLELDNVPGSLLAERLPAIRSLIEAKFTELDESIAAFRERGPDEAIDIVDGGRGRALMDQVRTEIEAISEAKARDRGVALARAELIQSRTNLYLLLLLGLAVLALTFAGGLARRAVQAEERAQNMVRLKAERDRADLVSRELSHRVKNLFAVILSIISTTARTEPDHKEAARKTRERVQALARAHSLSTGQRELRDARLEDLVREIVTPYAPAGRKVSINGPTLVLPAATVTPLGLIFNELATNALKYGAWSKPEGTVEVSWSFQESEGDDCLRLRWIEAAVPDTHGVTPQHRGFGTTMIDLSAQQANATVERFWKPGGLELVLDLKKVQG